MYNQAIRRPTEVFHIILWKGDNIKEVREFFKTVDNVSVQLGKWWFSNYFQKEYILTIKHGWGENIIVKPNNYIVCNILKSRIVNMARVSIHSEKEFYEKYTVLPFDTITNVLSKALYNANN